VREVATHDLGASEFRLAKVFEVASEISRIFERYQSIHDEVFGFSIRGLLDVVGRNGSASHAGRAQRLEELATQIRDVKDTIGSLEEIDLTRHSKNAVRSTLLDYARALEDSITRLQSICDNLYGEAEGLDDQAGYSENRLRSDKIRYDDSVQEYKRLGARLTSLFARV
jgi:hypothetical protein